MCPRAALLWIHPRGFRERMTPKTNERLAVKSYKSSLRQCALGVGTATMPLSTANI